MTDTTGTRTGDNSDAQQFFDTFRRSEYFEPETALIAAILEDAIHDYRKYCCARDAAGKERFREAEEWLMREGNGWIFSFSNVCEFLGLHPEYVRRGLRDTDRSRSDGEKHRRNASKRAA